MREVILKVKTITPTFMGGGMGKLDGIRTSEIKGMMRWWFRALAGAFVGDDFDKLKGLEGKFFGMTESKKCTKSKFKIAIEKPQLRFISNNLPIPSNGYMYLGIGNVLFKYDRDIRKFKPNKDKADQGGKVLIDAGSSFSLKFSFYPLAKEEDVNLAVGSFYLATALGGFGLRGRKCFGSWQIVGYEGEKLSFEPKEYAEETIRKNIEFLVGIIKNYTKNRTPASQYPSFLDSKYVFSAIKTNFTSYQELLDRFGQLYRGFRVCADAPKPGIPQSGIHTADFDFLKGNSKAQNCNNIGDFKNYRIRNALFGLNIIYPQLGNKSLQLERNLGDKKEILRRASPVWFSVKEIDGKLNLHITLLKSKFKPDNSEVKFDNKPIEIEDYSLIQEKFIPYIQKELGGGKNG